MPRGHLLDSIVASYRELMHQLMAAIDEDAAEKSVDREAGSKDMQQTISIGVVMGAVVALTGLAIAAYAIHKLARFAPGRLIAVIAALTALLGALPAIFRSSSGF